MSALERAASFLATHARLVERRLFEVVFGGADPESALAAILAYQNPDGGFGHAYEPDARISSSQPLFVHSALTSLRESGADATAAASSACGFVASVAAEDGSVPYLLPDAMEAARANHWNGDFALKPQLLATAGIAAGMHALGVRHEWLDRATAYCLRKIAGEPEYSGARLINVLDLLQQLPERGGLWEQATARLFEADYVLVETPVTTYGLTPLHFAPTPAAPARALFDDTVLEAHLEDLLARQQDDGGWPISWTPPPGAAANEWRGRWTLEAVRTLRAYGRV